eukprot:scaffold2857_cov344-Pavlova_lutheri.AAC.11
MMLLRWSPPPLSDPHEPSHFPLSQRDPPMGLPGGEVPCPPPALDAGVSVPLHGRDGWVIERGRLRRKKEPSPAVRGASPTRFPWTRGSGRVRKGNDAGFERKEGKERTT